MNEIVPQEINSNEEYKVSVKGTSREPSSDSKNSDVEPGNFQKISTRQSKRNSLANPENTSIKIQTTRRGLNFSQLRNQLPKPDNQKYTASQNTKSKRGSFQFAHPNLNVTTNKNFADADPYSKLSSQTPDLKWNIKQSWMKDPNKDKLMKLNIPQAPGQLESRQSNQSINAEDTLDNEFINSILNQSNNDDPKELKARNPDSQPQEE